MAQKPRDRAKLRATRPALRGGFWSHTFWRPLWCPLPLSSCQSKYHLPEGRGLPSFFLPSTDPGLRLNKACWVPQAHSQHELADLFSSQSGVLPDGCRGWLRPHSQLCPSPGCATTQPPPGLRNLGPTHIPPTIPSPRRQFTESHRQPPTLRPQKSRRQAA